MSHIEEATTTLKLTSLAALIRQGDCDAIANHPCMAILREAVHLAAHRHGGSIGETYQSYYGANLSTNIRLALRIPDKLPRGIGLSIDVQTGTLSFKGDPYGHRAFFDEIQQLIVQNYVVLAHGAALRRMHAHVSIQQMENQVVVTGVFHG